MSVLKQLQSELVIMMSEIDAICARYKYKAAPTLILRHPDGSDSSIVIGNDSLDEVARCIGDMSGIDNRSDMSPREAAIALIGKEATNDNAAI